MRKLIILGSGPAGLTSAIYAARANLEPLLFEGFQSGGQPGGQLMTTTDVENFPGFPEGIMGPDLMEAMRKQAVRFGTEIVTRDIDRVDFSQKPLRLWSGNQDYQAHALILATGASAKLLDLPSAKVFWQKGVSACATCDGALPPFRNQVMAVVGGGDTAIEEAVFLTRFGSKVALIHRRDQFRASKIMQAKAMNHPKIEVIFDTVVDEVIGTEFVTALKLKNVKTNAISEYPCRALFLAIGHLPNTKFLGGAVGLDDKGYISVRHPTTYTSVAGVFACGDVIDPHYRQAITSAGSGCAAALDAERWLADQGLG